MNLSVWTSLLLILAAALMSACQGASPTAEIDIANLPQAVDVATTKALPGQADVVLLDVREQSEYDAGHIPGVKLIPLGQVPARLAEIPKDKTVILTCRSGNRRHARRPSIYGSKATRRSTICRVRDRRLAAGRPSHR